MSRLARILPAALAAALLMTGGAEAAARLYQAADVWYSVARGAIAYSVFYANGADGARTYGTEGGADAIYARLRSAAPQAMTRVGVGLAESTGCREEETTNALGVAGWSFTCNFPIGGPSVAATAPAASPPVQAGTVTKANVPATARATPTPTPAAAPAPAPKLQPAATQTAPPPPAPSAPAATTVVATAGTSGDTNLNLRVKAELEAIDARNAQRKAEFEAAVKATEAARKAGEATYAAQLATYQAQVQETERKRQADLAAWQARVAACKAGDTSNCGQ